VPVRNKELLETQMKKMYVKYIYPGGDSSLTYGKVYVVSQGRPSPYAGEFYAYSQYKLDNDGDRWWHSSVFETVKCPCQIKNCFTHR